MHVAQAGPESGTPLLALHGWPQHWFMWRDLAGRLSEHGFRVICPDLRGQGWSGWPADGDFGKPRLVDDAVALLDALGVGAAHVVGHDWGGWTGFLLAQRAPARVRSLTALSIVAPWRRGNGAGRRDIAFAYQPLMATPGLGPAVARDPRLMAVLMRRATGRGFTWPPAALSAYLAPQRSRSVAEASSRLYRSFLLRELRQSAPETPDGGLAMPVLQLVGSQDLVRIRLDRVGTPPPPGWTVERVGGCGHFMVDERPEWLADRLLAFLAAR